MRYIALLAILLLAAPPLQSQEQPEQRQRPQRQMRDGQQRPNAQQQGQRVQRAGRGAMSDRFTKFAEHDPKVGVEAPDFTLNLLDGKEVRLSEFRGSKNVVLVFGSYT
jgi:hypothetical protein